MNFTRYRLLAAVCASSSLMACGAAPEGDQTGGVDPTQDEVTRILATHGFDASNLQFNGDEVIVEGDMVMSVRVILDAADKGVEKGYFYGSPFFAERAPGTILLTFESDLPSVWRTAFTQAAAAWSAVSGVEIATSFSLVDMLFAVPLKIKYYAFSTGFWPLPVVPDTSTFARGWYPPWDGAGTVAVNAGYSGTCFTGTNAAIQRKKTAMHEIGHALGLTHRQDGEQIPGTASGSTYSTVMASGCLNINSLSSDDLASMNFIYAFDLPDSPL